MAALLLCFNNCVFACRKREAGKSGMDFAMPAKRHTRGAGEQQQQ
jgi:hypothetical protein